MSELNRFLQALSTEELIKHFPTGGTTTVLDGVLFTQHPRATFIEGRTHRVPYMLGYTSSDGYSFALNHIAAVTDNAHVKLNSDIIEKAVNTLLFEMFRHSAKELGYDRKLLKMYKLREDDVVGKPDWYLLKCFSELAADAMYVAQIALAASCHSGE